MEKERIVEMCCPECEEGTARREKTLFKRRIGKEIFVIPEVEHLVCDKCGYEFIPEDVWEYVLNAFRNIKGEEKERAVHLNGKITKSKDQLSVNIQNIEKHLKLRNGEEVELYANDDEIVIMPKGMRV
jgi:YgiT-type zinc finger domain-containing protein